MFFILHWFQQLVMRQMHTMNVTFVAVIEIFIMLKC